MASLSASKSRNDSPGVCGDETAKYSPAAVDVLVLFWMLGVGRSVRRGSGDGRPSFLERRSNRLRGKDGICVEGESQGAEGNPSRIEDASSSVLIGIVSELYLLVDVLSFSGAAKVSAPIEGRPRKVLRLKLLSLERLLEPPLGLVGVGGMSSALDWLSVIVRLAVGDCVSGSVSSSPSMLTKLPRR
jgi:hypothetical protein